MADLSKLSKFSRKDYRDGFMQTQVRGGIAYQIQALRKKFGFTQSKMAEQTGKKQSVISRLENTEYGKVTVQTLLDIASALDVAILVQFVSYPDFLTRTSDMSDKALQPETIHESLGSFHKHGSSINDSYSKPWFQTGVAQQQGAKFEMPHSPALYGDLLHQTASNEQLGGPPIKNLGGTIH